MDTTADLRNSGLMRGARHRGWRAASGGDKRRVYRHTAATEGKCLDPDYFKTVFDYHYWARDRLLAAAQG